MTYYPRQTEALVVFSATMDWLCLHLLSALQDRLSRAMKNVARHHIAEGPVVATRHNPVIRGLYERPCVAGKATKAAIAACIRKLLTVVKAMIKQISIRHDCPDLAATS